MHFVVQHVAQQAQKKKQCSTSIERDRRDMQVAAATVVVATLWGNMENLPQKKRKKNPQKSENRKKQC